MITINNLNKSYGNQRILQNIHLKLPDKRIAFLMGKNGSGKTTLLKCLTGLEDYTGEVLFDHAPLQEVREQLFAVFDDCPLYTHLTGYQNLTLLSQPGRLHHDTETIALQLLNNDILHARVSRYSYGQRKKLSLILAMLAHPSYLLMDEVSNGLDFESLELLRAFVRDRSQHASVLLTGHQFEFYEPLIDELFVLKDTEIIHIEDYQQNRGKLGEIYKKYYQ